MRKLGNTYGCSHMTISRWLMAHKKSGKKQPLQFSAAGLSSEEAIPTDIKELQEALRQSRLKIELLEAMIDIADEQLGTEIRKKAGTRQS